MYKYIGFIIVKLIFQKVVGILHLETFQEFVKRKLFKRVVVTQDLLTRKLEDKLLTLNLLGVPITGTVVEQGTGWHGQDCMLFILLGATKVVSYDTTGWLNESLVRCSASTLLEKSDEVYSFSSLDISEFNVKLKIIKDFFDNDERYDIGVFFAELDITICTTRELDYGCVEKRSAQIFYTDSVLQRMAPDVLEDMFNAIEPYLAKGAKHIHIVDCKDFHAIDTNAIPELGYLLVSDFWARLISSKYLNYQNHLRVNDYITVFQRYADQVEVFDKCVAEKNLDFVKKSAKLKMKYPGYSAEDIAVSKFTAVIST